MRVDAPTFASYREFYEATYGRFKERVERLPMATLVVSAQPAGDGSVQATPDLVLGHIRHGRGKYWADLGGGRFHGRLDAGETLLLAPNTFNAIQTSGRHGVELLAMPYGTLRRTFGDDLRLPADGDFGPLHGNALANPVYSRMIAALCDVGDYGNPAARLLLEGTLTSLVALLAIESGRATPRARLRGGLADWQLRRVSEALAAVEARVSLGELAALVNLSPYHFCRAFKRSTGLPPHRYQMMLRVERAKDLLANSTLSIVDIAAAVGYEDQSHFTAVFRRHVRTTPSDYRRQRRR